MSDNIDPSNQIDPSLAGPSSVDQSNAAGSFSPPSASEPASFVSSEPRESTGRFGSKKILIALGSVAALVIGAVVFFAASGSSGASNESVLLAYDPSGSGTYYTAEIKDGKAVIGGRITAEDIGSFDVRADINDSDSSDRQIVAIDKKTVLLRQYPDGDSEDAVDFVKVDLDTLQVTNLFSSKDGATGIYLAKEGSLLVTDDDACFRVSMDGISTRLGNGECFVAGGRISVAKRDGVESRYVYLDDKGNPTAPITIKIDTLDSHSADRSRVWGRMENGEVVVFDTLTGKQIWKYGNSDVLVSILTASLDGSSLLVAIDELENTDEKVDLAVVADADGSPTVKVLVSDFRVGGVIAPDGKGALTYNQSADSESGTLQYFGPELTNPKVIGNGMKITDIGVASNGVAAVVTEDGVYSGSFDAGFERKAEGSFSGIYDDSVLSVAGTNALLMNLKASNEDSKNQLIYLPAPLATDGSTNAVVVATGDDGSYLVNDNSLSKSGRIIYALSSDDYTIINERELKRDAASTRVAEGRLSTYFEVENDTLRYYESSGDNRYTTYELKGTDAADRSITADGYYLVEIPVGDFGNKLVEVSWNYYTREALVDDDLDSCRKNGYSIIKQDESATIELKTNTANEYVWTYFCVQTASDGNSTYVHTTDVAGYGSGKPLWMRMTCWNSDESSTDVLDEKEIANSGSSGVYGYFTNTSGDSYASCRIADNAYHGGYYTTYSNGGTVVVHASESFND